MPLGGEAAFRRAAGGAGGAARSRGRGHRGAQEVSHPLAGGHPVAPLLAVPSVAAFHLDREPLDGLPWAAARGRIAPVLAKLDRVAAALAEAERRFQGALDRRDELRGLLQAFADKASAGGVMELPELDSLYQETKAVLWAAPCDLDRGGALVDRYVATVNTKVQEVAR